MTTTEAITELTAMAYTGALAKAALETTRTPQPNWELVTQQQINANNRISHLRDFLVAHVPSASLDANAAK